MGCAKCCLHKFIDDDSVDERQFTDKIRDNEQVHIPKYWPVVY